MTPQIMKRVNNIYQDKIEMLPYQQYMEPNSIQAYHQDMIVSEDCLSQRKSSYFKVSSVDFQFTEYNNGTHELRQKYQIGKKLTRYFGKREFLFSRFNQGIRIDQESWYSVIPEPVSLYLLQRVKMCNIKKILEPFCGVGGVAVHFAGNFQEYVVNDLDLAKVKMLKQNMKIYKKPIKSLKYYNMDFLEMQPFETDLVILCPPWGGINTNEYSSSDLDEIMIPKLSEILIHARKFSENMILQMPKQTNIANLISILYRSQLKGIFTVEKIKTNGRTSQLLFYFGRYKFMQIKKSIILQTVMQACSFNQQNIKKRNRVVRALKAEESLQSQQLYELRYPNKHIFLS